MNNLFNQIQIETNGLPQVIKITSLLYLKDALNREEYEQCPELIQTAKDNGATKEDVQKEILGFIANVKAKNRVESFVRKP
jgi:hypothetical protein